MRFSHIFAIPGDEATLNNFYKQILISTDGTPVSGLRQELPAATFEKKAEIDNQVQALSAKDLNEVPHRTTVHLSFIVVSKKSANGEKR